MYYLSNTKYKSKTPLQLWPFAVLWNIANANKQEIGSAAERRIFVPKVSLRLAV